MDKLVFVFSVLMLLPAFPYISMQTANPHSARYVGPRSARSVGSTAFRYDIRSLPPTAFRSTYAPFPNCVLASLRRSVRTTDTLYQFFQCSISTGYTAKTWEGIDINDNWPLLSHQ